MKIALVNDWFLPYVSEQAIGLRSAGAEVLVICRDHLQEFGGRASEWQACIDAMHAAGVSTCVVRGRSLSVTAARSATIAARRLHRFRPDIIHAHPSRDPWLHLVIARRPFVLTVHDPVEHPGQPAHGRILTALSDAWITRANAFIVHSEALVAPLRPSAGSRPIGVVPHGVRPTPRPRPVPEAPCVLFFGRLEPYKGISVLVAAMHRVWDVRPDVELVVAGDGPCRRDVPEHPKIRRLFRYIPDAEREELLASASVVCAAYSEASQSGVVSLAVARGIPAVVSDRGGLPDLAIEPGMIVPADEVGPLADALLRYLDHTAELRHRIHAFACHTLSWEAVGRRAIDLYPRLVDPVPPE